MESERQGMEKGQGLKYTPTVGRLAGSTGRLRDSQFQGGELEPQVGDGGYFKQTNKNTHALTPELEKKLPGPSPGPDGKQVTADMHETKANVDFTASFLLQH